MLVENSECKMIFMDTYYVGLLLAYFALTGQSCQKAKPIAKDFIELTQERKHRAFKYSYPKKLCTTLLLYIVIFFDSII